MVWREVRATAGAELLAAAAGHAGLHAPGRGRSRVTGADVEASPFHTPTTHIDGRLGALVGHVCIAYDNLCLVHGGKLDGRLCGGELWCLDLLTEVWTRLEIEGLRDEDAGGAKKNDKSVQPSARWKHCACTHTRVNPTVKMEVARRVPKDVTDDVIAARAGTAADALAGDRIARRPSEGVYPLSGEEESQRRLKKIVHEERQRNEEQKARDRDGLLMTAGATPCVVRTTRCVLWGGGGQAKKTADLWELRLDSDFAAADSAGGTPAMSGLSWAGHTGLTAASAFRSADDPTSPLFADTV